MNDKEKMQKFVNEGQELISKKVNNGSPEFKAWHTKVERLLSSKFGDKSIELKNFRGRIFGPIGVVSIGHDDSPDCARDIEATILELKSYIEEEAEETLFQLSTTPHNYDQIFVVHGHDGEIKQEIARLLEKQSIVPIILNEQANQGKTIIEKLEKYSDVSAAVILMTNDDTGKEKNETESKPRARQNVVFEAGYFMGKLGRDRVVLIAEEKNEIPSDLHGMVYTDKRNWQFDFCKELKAMGFSIDMNKLI